MFMSDAKKTTTCLRRLLWYNGYVNKTLCSCNHTVNQSASGPLIAICEEGKVCIRF